MQLFSAMGVGASSSCSATPASSARRNDFTLRGRRAQGRASSGSGCSRTRRPIPAGGGDHASRRPRVSPAYLGVGYIIGPSWASLNFAGGLLAWGLFVPLLIFFLGPAARARATPTPTAASAGPAMAGHLWRFIVRPIAVGGMLVGAELHAVPHAQEPGIGIKRGVADLKKSAAAKAATERTERDLSLQDRVRRDRGRVRADDRALLLLHEGAAGRHLSPAS